MVCLSWLGVVGGGHGGEIKLHFLSYRFFFCKNLYVLSVV